MQLQTQQKVACKPMSFLTPVCNGLLQRKCGCDRHTVAGGKCTECREQWLHRKTSNYTEPETVPQIVHEALHSSEQPLGPASRAFIKPHFGHDFSRVCVHTEDRGTASTKNPANNGVNGEQAFKASTNRHGQRAIVSDTHIPRIACKLVFDTGIRQIADTRNPSLPVGVALPPTMSPTSPTPSRRRRACVSSERIPDNRTGIMFQQMQVNDYFEMNIDWNNTDPGCDCRCGEYRQFVKGHIKINGRKQTKPLWGGVNLEEHVYHEDGDDNRSRYGHRNDTETTSDRFVNPDRLAGCSYRGRDTPGVQIQSGVHLDMLLNFKGQTYDICTNNFGKIHEWTVEYNGVVP